MYKQNFGTQNQIHFNDENEYYEFLGYLAKSDGSTSLTWEHNEEQGAWGSEGRIHFYIQNPPISATLQHTAGTGNIVSRVNCNEFVENIVTHNNFIMGNIQDLNLIRRTIPQLYLVDFDRGYNL